MPAEALQAADHRVQAALSSRQRLLGPADDALLPSPGQLQQLSRLTLIASDAAATAALFTPGNTGIAAYNILAVQPTTERVFTQVSFVRASSLTTVSCSAAL